MEQVLFQLKLNDTTQIQSYVISIARESMICSGTTAIEIQFSPELPHALIPGTQLVLYEYNIYTDTYYKDKEYFVFSRERSASNDMWIVKCQDGSKYLQEYYIDEPFETTRGHTARHWIEEILDLTTIDVVWNASSDGEDMDAVISLGMQSAYDAIITLCQQNGWYFYINSNNKCVIDSVDFSPSSYSFTLTSSNILNIELHQDDEMLRNRAVVWGGTDFNTRDKIFSDETRSTAWDRNSLDKRAVLIANGAIGSQSIADKMSAKILDEFARITVTKTIDIDGMFPVQPLIGQGVRVKSDIWTGVGMITTISSSISNAGYQTTIVLDERCPRLFAYFRTWDFDFPIITPYYPSEYAYVGTNGAGIYRKEFSGAIWTSYNDGLSDLFITDLYINAGVLVCTTAGGVAYTRMVGDASWTAFKPDDILDESTDTIYTWEDITAVACAINQTTGEIYIAYNVNIGQRSWTIILSSVSDVYITKQVVIDDTNYNFIITDLDTNQAGIFAIVEYSEEGATGFIVGIVDSIDTEFFTIESDGDFYDIYPPEEIDFDDLYVGQLIGALYNQITGISGNTITADNVSIGIVRYKQQGVSWHTGQNDFPQTATISVDTEHADLVAGIVVDSSALGAGMAIQGWLGDGTPSWGGSFMKVTPPPLSVVITTPNWPTSVTDLYTSVQLTNFIADLVAETGIQQTNTTGLQSHWPTSSDWSSLKFVFKSNFNSPPFDTTFTKSGYLYLVHEDSSSTSFFPTVGGGGEPSAKYVIRTNPDSGFEVVFEIDTDNDRDALKLEISRNYPVVLYGSKSQPGTSSIPDADFGLMYTSDFGDADSFLYNVIGEFGYGQIPDLRVFDLYGSVTVIDDVITIDPSVAGSNRYVAFTQNDGTIRFKHIGSFLGSASILASFSGSPTKHLEITNYSYAQHFFVSISGSPGRMFQKLNTQTQFYEISAGLPSVEITCVRIDDYL